jgi:hypothetical protein
MSSLFQLQSNHSHCPTKKIGRDGIGEHQVWISLSWGGMESSRGGFPTDRHIVRGPLGSISASDSSREDWIVLAIQQGRQKCPTRKGNHVWCDFLSSKITDSRHVRFWEYSHIWIPSTATFPEISDEFWLYLIFISFNSAMKWLLSSIPVTQISHIHGKWADAMGW